MVELPQPTDARSGATNDGNPLNLSGLCVNAIDLGSRRPESAWGWKCSRGNVELYLEFETGNVCLRWPSEQGHAVVNSTFAAFRESLLFVDARYPFYPRHRDLDVSMEAEEELRRMLVGIDIIGTADPDGYWSSFLEDVAVGDYAGRLSS